MAKWRKKPIVIEAEQWISHIEFPIVNGIVEQAKIQMLDSDSEWECEICGFKAKEHGNVKTLEGFHIVCPNDWIIKGVKGEFYPCKSDIFELTYEKVEEN